MIFKDAEEVIRLLTPIINLFKEFDPKFSNPKKTPKVKDLPDFYPNYKTAVLYAERIRIHSETGKFPDSLFMARYPNQTDKEFEYMKNNYKQNTLPVFVDFVSTMTRPFSDGNWNIEYKDDNDRDSFQRYVENDIEVVRSLKEYVRGLLPSLKTVDANGVIAIRPEKIFKILNEETGEEEIDNVTRVNPQPYYFPIENVLSDTRFDDDYFILHSLDKSEVEYGNQKVKKGHVFEIHDENNIWRAVQVGKFTEYTFQVDIFYSHNAGRIMASRMKGVPQYVNGSYLWQSQFMYGCDLLDLALMNANYLQCTVAQRMFPYLVMLGSKCAFKEKDANGIENRCDGGSIFDSVLGLKTCPSCHGSGLRDRLSHMGVMKIEPPSSEPGSETEMKMMDKAMYYVEPPTQSAEFVRDKIESDLAKARDVVKIKASHMANGAGINPNDATATKEILDQKAQYAAVKLFSDQLFDLYDFLLFGIGFQRYQNSHQQPTLVKPTSFDFNTEADYLNNISMAIKADIPSSVIAKQIQKYLETIYYNQKKTAKVYDLISVTDRLFILKQDDILIRLARNLVEPWEVILHDSALQFIEQLEVINKRVEFCDEDDCTKGFFALDFAEQQNQLREIAKKRASEIAAAIPAGTSLIDQARQRALPPAA